MGFTFITLIVHDMVTANHAVKVLWWNSKTCNGCSKLAIKQKQQFSKQFELLGIFGGRKSLQLSDGTYIHQPSSLWHADSESCSKRFVRESKNVSWLLKVGKKAKTAIFELIWAFWYFWREKIIRYSCLMHCANTEFTPGKNIKSLIMQPKWFQSVTLVIMKPNKVVEAYSLTTLGALAIQCCQKFLNMQMRLSHQVKI